MNWCKHIPKDAFFIQIVCRNAFISYRVPDEKHGTGDTLTIKIKIEILGLLKKPRNLRNFEFEMPDNSTMEDLLLELDYSREHCRYILAVKNGIGADRHTVLSDGDEVVLTLPVGGG